MLGDLIVYDESLGIEIFKKWIRSILLWSGNDFGWKSQNYFKYVCGEEKLLNIFSATLNVLHDIQ